MTKLASALNGADNGQIDGVMLVIRHVDGTHSCASAGWYSRHGERALRPAIIGLAQLCDPDRAAMHEGESWFAPPALYQ